MFLQSVLVVGLFCDLYFTLLEYCWIYFTLQEEWKIIIWNIPIGGICVKTVCSHLWKILIHDITEECWKNALGIWSRCWGICVWSGTKIWQIWHLVDGPRITASARKSHLAVLPSTDCGSQSFADTISCRFLANKCWGRSNSLQKCRDYG